MRPALHAARVAVRLAHAPSPLRTDELIDVLPTGACTADRRDELVNALDRREFVPYYQPIYDRETRRLVAIEALARWRRDGEVLGPDRFLADIEAHRLHHQLGARMLLAGMRDLQRLQRGGTVGRDVRVHVNVSAVQLDAYRRVNEVERCAIAHGLQMGSLTVELTETSLLHDPALARAMLTTCRDRGVPIALDDVGAGYSSLTMLRTLPVDEIKIDRSFVADVDTDRVSQAIVAGLAEIGHRLGVTVTAEGVERIEQDRMLGDLGVDRVQGYLYARPMSLDDLVRSCRTPSWGLPGSLRRFRS